MKIFPNREQSSRAQCEREEHPRLGNQNQCWCGHVLYSERK